MRRHSMKQHRDAQGLFLGWGTVMESGWGQEEESPFEPGVCH